MKRWVWATGMVTTLALLAPVVGQDKSLTIKEAMRKLHKGSENIRVAVGRELKADPIEWEQIQKDTKVYHEFAEVLPKNAPPRGEKAAWEKVSSEFVDQAKALSESAKKKDLSGAKTAYAKLGGSCKNCHNAHK